MCSKNDFQFLGGNDEASVFLSKQEADFMLQTVGYYFRVMHLFQVLGNLSRVFLCLHKKNSRNISVHNLEYSDIEVKILRTQNCQNDAWAHYDIQCKYLVEKIGLFDTFRGFGEKRDYFGEIVQGLKLASKKSVNVNVQFESLTFLDSEDRLTLDSQTDPKIDEAKKGQLEWSQFSLTSQTHLEEMTKVAQALSQFLQAVRTMVALILFFP